MTERAKRRQRPETVEQRYDRLNRRIVRRLPVSAAETAFVWREKSRRLRTEKIIPDHVDVGSQEHLDRLAEFFGILRSSVSGDDIR